MTTSPIQHFAISPDGTLYITSGFEAVRAWDGLAASIRDAGVPAPPNKATIADSGTGQIMGEIYGYQRFLDSDGRVSNLSPVSAVLSISSNSGSITAATNASPIQITSTAHLLTTGDKVFISGVLGNVGANGLWTITKVDDDTFTLDESEGTGDYSGGGTWKQGADTITYSNLDAPDDSRVTKRQMLRTKHGDAGTAYVDLEKTDLVSTTFASTTVDDDLGAAVVLEDIDGDDLNVAAHGFPPDYKTFSIHQNGRMLMSGHPEYREGAVKVTNGSTSVTGIGTGWTDAMKGRFLYVVGAAKEYEISSVNVANQTLTLAENYDSSSDAYARYGIRPSSGNRRTFHWSEAALPESFNPTNAEELPEDSQAGEVTGHAALHRFYYIFSEHRIYRVSFQDDPGKDGFLSFAPQRGAINNRCIVTIEDYLYVLDRQGIYAFAGNDYRDLSEPIQDIFTGGSSSKYRVDWRWRKYFHVAHDPEDETVKFFVSMGGRYPKHALCYHYRARRWWVEEYPVGVTSSALGILNGRRLLFLGSEARTIFAAGTGHLDGVPADSGTLRGTVTSAGVDWIKDTSATFPPSADIVNRSIRIVDGTGKGQMRRITAISGSQIDVLHPWTTRPDTTSVYQIAGIEWAYKTPWMRWDEEDTEQPRRVELVFEPLSATAQMDLRIYHDRSATPERFRNTMASVDNNGVQMTEDDPNLVIDPTFSTGYVEQGLRSQRETTAHGNRFVALELKGVTNGERQVVYAMGLDAARQ